jgi:lysosomal acid lipase/cholesteryl ester hydrolase
VLDRWWSRSPLLQRVFNKRLGNENGRNESALRGGKGPEEEDTTPDLIRAAGFGCESHSVRTEDGFWLVLFRIVPPNGHDGDCVSRKRPVLFMHGLMLSSDSFLATGARSLPIVLARAGHDVWLGNNRGNRYSHKHDRLSPDCDAYWDYCLDELARFDVPALVHYVLRMASTTEAFAKLTYCGFSNGTAQGFAALALHPGLSERVGCFIALSPAVAVNSIQESLVKSLIASRLHMIYLLFGRKKMLGITATAQRLLSPEFFAWSMDKAVRFLFGWRMEHISQAEKARVYRHTYSYSSVKQVVHWFQMIQSGSPGLKMWDANVTPSRLSHRKPPLYDTRRIRTENCKIYCWVGTKDTLVDTEGLVDVLPKGTIVTHVEGLTHLEIMWADGLDTGVFREVEARISEAFE